MHEKIKNNISIKIIEIMLIIILCFAAMYISMDKSYAETVASGDCGANGDNVTWVIDSEGTLTISGIGAIKNYGDVGEAPWTMNYSPNIKSIVVDEGVTEIGNFAFSLCGNAETVTLPNSVKKIGIYAFANCEKLTSICVPEGVTEIAQQTFFFCARLEDVKLPETLVTINSAAFYGCGNLNEIIMPKSVKYIEGNAFDGGINYKNIYYKGSIDEWNEININSTNSSLANVVIHYDVVDKSTHTFTKSIIKPTCIDVGYELYTCTCGVSYRMRTFGS